MEDFLSSFDKEVSALKEEFFKISWYMRGGITTYELFNFLTQEDRVIIWSIISSNIELTKKSGLPLM